MKTNKIDRGAVFQRWMVHRNRRQEEPGYLEEWRIQQCLHCMYYVPLSGALGEDYGACTNGDSKFDHHVMFEHDGCEMHLHAEGDGASG